MQRRSAAQAQGRMRRMQLLYDSVLQGFFDIKFCRFCRKGIADFAVRALQIVRAFSAQLVFYRDLPC